MLDSVGHPMRFLIWLPLFAVFFKKLLHARLESIEKLKHGHLVDVSGLHSQLASWRCLLAGSIQM